MPRPPAKAQHLADTLAGKIEDGAYPVGSWLPSERELAHEHGADRSTVRRALRILGERGVVSVIDGTGAQVPVGRPDVVIEDDGRVQITGYKPGHAHTPDNEVTIEAPARLVPELTALDIPDFAAFRRSVRQTPGDSYRVQTLTQYGVPSDDEDFQRYLSGGEPQSPYRAPWFEQLRQDTAAGRTYRNLHVVNGPLSDYLRYQFEWAYAYNVQYGQDVRILDTAEHPAAAALFRTGDFWVLEHKHVVLCRYDQDGGPLGTVDAAGAEGFIAAAEMAWGLATPFTTWWNAHIQYHRASAQSAY